MASSASDSPSSDRNVCSRPNCDDSAGYPEPVVLSFYDLAPVLHTNIAFYLEVNDVLRVGSGARWCQESYKPHFTNKLFIPAQLVRQDPARSKITNEAELTL